MQIKIETGADAGKEITIPATGAAFTIGRNAACDFVLNDPKASSRHASLTLGPNGTVTVADLGSTNGTFVNGQRVATATVTPRDRFQIGDTLFSPKVAAFAAAGAGAPPPPQAPAPPQQPATPGPPSNVPVQRPSRTHSAIQRIQVIKSTRRAMYVGIAVLVVLVVGIGLGLAGVYSGGGDDDDLSATVDNVKDGVVYVRSDGGRGTGWVYDLDNRHLVTNQHVTQGASEVQVGIGEELRPARVVGEAECEDLAVLEIADAAGLKGLALGSQSRLKIGDPVIAVGYPASVGEGGDFDRFDLSGSDGTVAVPETSNGPYTNLVRTTAQINSGQSGGPLVTADEEVVGVTTVTFSDKEKFDIENGAIGIDRVKEIVPKLVAGQQVC